jgi:hypothetical protein
MKWKKNKQLKDHKLLVFMCTLFNYVHFQNKEKIVNILQEVATYTFQEVAIILVYFY